MMKRRQFAQSMTLLAAGVALPAIASIPSVLCHKSSDTVQADLCREYFETRVGMVFQQRDSQSRTFVLKGVENACGNASRDQFLAIFEASPGARLQEGIYQLESPRAGRLDLYLTESDQSKTRQQFVAIFNLQAPV
jgi:hypothetical protein